MKCSASCFGWWLYRYMQLSKFINLSIQDLCVLIVCLKKFEISWKKKRFKSPLC